MIRSSIRRIPLPRTADACFVPEVIPIRSQVACVHWHYEGSWCQTPSILYLHLGKRAWHLKYLHLTGTFSTTAEMIDSREWIQARFMPKSWNAGWKLLLSLTIEVLLQFTGQVSRTYGDRRIGGWIVRTSSFTSSS